MRLSILSVVAEGGETYSAKKDSDGWVWVYVGDVSYLLRPEYVKELVQLRDALNEILEGVPVPEAQVPEDELGEGEEYLDDRWGVPPGTPESSEEIF